jgi:hypothetical protein
MSGHPLHSRHGELLAKSHSGPNIPNATHQIDHCCNPSLPAWKSSDLCSQNASIDLREFICSIKPSNTQPGTYNRGKQRKGMVPSTCPLCSFLVTIAFDHQPTAQELADIKYNLVISRANSAFSSQLELGTKEGSQLGGGKSPVAPFFRCLIC